MKDNNFDTVDMMISRSSTLPYDSDQMQKMAELVEKAKRTLSCRIRDSTQ